jgi:hypothetical protein
MRRRIVVALSIGVLLIAASVAFAAHGGGGHHRRVPKSLLVGSARVASAKAVVPAGSVSVFPFKSRRKGTARAVRIYVGAHNHAHKLIVGVYTYRHGRPHKRLTYGTLTKAHARRWNVVTLHPAKIHAGRRYGISVLGSGPVRVRDDARGCHGSRSEQLMSKGMPIAWRGGKRQGTCSISAYVVGSRRAPADTSPPAGPDTGATVVGSAGAPVVACDRTLDPGADIQGALAAANPGDVVCLNAGDWGHETLSGLTPAAPGVTLAPAPDAIGQVNMDGLETTGEVDELTVEGINFSSTFAVHAGAHDITLDYDDFQHFPDYAIELCGGCVNDGPSIDNVTMSYNQIDHTFYCLRVATPGGGYTFSHNVCGPGIGEGGNDDAHYIQAEGNDNVAIDNNAFEGPANADAIANGAHLNVAHQYGNNLQFDNNIVWRTQTVAQTVLWGDDGPVHGGQANNNLFLEAPSPATYSLWIDKAHDSSDVTFSNNTVVNSTSYGAFVNESASGFSAQDNLAVSPHAYDGFRNCDCSHNVAAHSPSWQTTDWTPNDGSPWNPPPAGYYQPSGSSVGYLGSIGP